MGGAGALRNELVGHGTIVVLALLGLAIYSTTYGLIYSMSTSNVVATLEMFMIYAHLAVACACGAAQLVLPIVLHLTEPIPHLASTQCAIFLGIALSVSLLAGACMGSATGNECALFFGAAMLPQLAAAGAATWAWIVYLASLSCQTKIEGLGGLTAAAAMSWVPWVIAKTAVATCGDEWRVLLCGGVNVALAPNATTTASQVAADCSNLDLGLWVSAAGLLLAEIASWIPYAGARLVGALLGCLGALVAWLAQPSDVAVPAAPVPYHVCVFALALSAAVYEAWLLLRASSSRRSSTRKHRGARLAASRSNAEEDSHNINSDSDQGGDAENPLLPTSSSSSGAAAATSAHWMLSMSRFVSPRPAASSASRNKQL